MIPLLARVDKVNQPKPNSLRITGSVDIRNVELHNVQTRQSGNLRTGAVEIYIFQQDLRGGVLDQVRDKLRLQLTNENYAAYLRSGVLFREYIQPKSGLTTLRVLIGDPNSGAIGSLIVPVKQIR